jgi:hypothetical protein
LDSIVLVVAAVDMHWNWLVAAPQGTPPEAVAEQAVAYEPDLLVPVVGGTCGRGVVPKLLDGRRLRLRVKRNLP